MSAFNLLLLALAGSAARTFTDDAGVTHTTTKSHPTIITVVEDGISLVQFGLRHEQLKATIGARATSGSNVNGVYADGNVNDHGAHSSADYDPRHFPADPTAAERSVLAHAVDLSPSCSSGNFWCAAIDIEKLNEIGAPDFIVQGSFGTSYPFTDASTPGIEGNLTAMGAPVITINYDDTTTGVGRGMIEQIERYEQLAIFLGVTGAAENSAKDKAHLCAAVSSFKHIAHEARSKGVRAMATYSPYLTPTASGVMGGYLYSPHKELVLLMLEELGMPLLHTGSSSEKMISEDWSTGLMSASDLKSADGSASYPVDFWLYDVRVTLDFLSSSFAAAWPHPAVTARQFASWHNNARHFSYVHATDILTMVGNALASAERLLPATDCTPVTGGVSGTAYRTDGLTAGQYACAYPVEYAWCSDHSDLHANRKLPPPPPGKPPPPPDTLSPPAAATCDESLATGAVAGIAVGCLVAGSIIGLGLGYVIAGRSKLVAVAK